MRFETHCTLFVAFVLLHNAEEALWLLRWSESAGRWHRVVGATEFRFAVFALSLLLVAFGVAALIFGQHSFAAYLFFGYTFAMAANALIPHLAASLVLRKYMPGTATGLLLVLPFGATLLHRAIQESWVQPAILIWVAPAVSLSLILAIPILFRLGRRILTADGIHRRQTGQ